MKGQESAKKDRKGLERTIKGNREKERVGKGKKSEGKGRKVLERT